jgi:Mce-associated membrane protein
MSDQKSNEARNDELAEADTIREHTEAETAEELTHAESADVEGAEPGTESPWITPPPARRGIWSRIGIGVLAALLVASCGLTAWLYFHTYRPDQQTGTAASDTALSAAKDGTVAVLSYSPENLDKDLDSAKSHLTGDFLTYYSQFTDQVVRPAVKTKQVSTSANIVRAAVSEMHPDQAKVLVFVNQTTTSSDRNEPSQSASSVIVTLKKVDDKWLISAFDPV